MASASTASASETARILELAHRYPPLGVVLKRPSASPPEAPPDAKRSPGNAGCAKCGHRPSGCTKCAEGGLGCSRCRFGSGCSSCRPKSAT